MHTCALFANHRSLCFGGNDKGQLGRDSTLNLSGLGGDVLGSAPFIDFSDNNLGITHLATGGQHTCVLRFDMSVICFGDNGTGQLAAGVGVNLGDSPNEMTMLSPIAFDPALVPYTLLGLVSVDLSSGQTITMNPGQTYYYIGVPQSREISIVSYVKTTMASSVYINVGSDGHLMFLFNIRVEADSYMTRYVLLVRMRPAAVIAAGTAHACLLGQGGKVACWGRNNMGQLGQDMISPIGPNPNDMTSLTPIVFGAAFGAMTIVDIAAGLSDHTCALFSEGKVSCWGSNSSGQLGLDVATTFIGGASGDMTLLAPISFAPTITHRVTQLAVAYLTSCGI